MSEYIITCDEETASWIGNDVDLMKRIVRCRDCRFSRIFDGKGYPGKKYEGMTYCINWGDGYQGEWVKPDGYCHRAKRKEGGDD